MRTLLFATLLSLIAFCKSAAQTNSLSPELRKEIEAAEAKHEFMLTNRQPVLISINFRDGGTSCQISYWGNTNMVVYVPIPEQQFDFHLFSMNGKEIPKTSDNKFGQRLKPDQSLLNGNSEAVDVYSESYTDNIYDRRLDFNHFNHSHFWRFDILKLFQIEKPGEYRLQVTVRLFTKDPSGVFQPFILAPVETKVNFNNLGK
jgi:hypothetical protein